MTTPRPWSGFTAALLCPRSVLVLVSVASTALFAEPVASPETARQELVALLRADLKSPAIAPETLAAVETYLADKTRPASDRLAVKEALGMVRLVQSQPKTRSDVMAGRAALAREVIAEFPAQPDGYESLLSIARGEEPDRARSLAEELIASTAPDPIKIEARRILERLALIGQPLQLDAAAEALASAKGRPVVLYTWSTEGTPGFLDMIRHLAENDQAAFIGINLDNDPAAAKTLATELNLPGVQIYDGHGMDGVAARQLKLTTLSSVYLLDEEGRVQDIDAHREARRKLAQLTAKKGDQS